MLISTYQEVKAGKLRIPIPPEDKTRRGVCCIDMDKKKTALIVSTIAAITAALATLCVVITKKKRGA